MASLIYTVDVIDHSNFSVKLCSTRAFSNYNVAHSYGSSRRDSFREAVKHKGETDEAFIEAIVYEVHEIELDEWNWEK